MERDGELDHAQAGPQVSARHSDGIDHFLPQLVGHLAQVGIGEPAQVRGHVNLVKQWGF
jgi:hypothetical protein